MHMSRKAELLEVTAKVARRCQYFTTEDLKRV
jgi:hypothetical protein